MRVKYILTSDDRDQWWIPKEPAYKLYMGVLVFRPIHPIIIKALTSVSCLCTLGYEGNSVQCDGSALSRAVRTLGPHSL